MATLVTPTQMALTMRQGLFGRLWQRFRDGRMQRSMFRIAPTRKM